MTPLVPLWVFELLAKVLSLSTKSYPERYVVRLASIVGKLFNGDFASVSRYWARFEEVRTPASIRDPSTLGLWLCLERTQPGTILEFGTGFSTLVMAAYATLQFERRGQRILITSIEHDATWYELQARTLERFNLSPLVRLVHAPLAKQSHNGGEITCYDLTKESLLDSLESSFFDFVFVDGPVGTRFGGPGRKGSLSQAVSLTKPGGLFLLHDALRDEEYEMLRKLLKLCKNEVKCLGIVPDADGLAVLKKRDKGKQ